MVVIFDTNHFTEFVNGTKLGKRLMARVSEHEPDVFCCIVAAEESLKGWLALIHSRKNGGEQVEAYTQLLGCIVALNKFTILPFDREAAAHFHLLEKQLPGIGRMDLKIAAIALSHDATLLSRNLRDFDQIPGLLVENWLD